MSKRPNDQVQTFFESIGVDPEMVPMSGVDNRGYYTYILRSDGSRALTCGNGDYLRYFHEWPDSTCWMRFRQAEFRDYRENLLH